MPNVGGKCPIEAFAADWGAPHYCSFDSALGCQTTNPCTAAKLKAVGDVALRTLKCDSVADLKGVAVNPVCTTKALGALTAAFAKADALGPCPGTAATLQNDISVLESNLNTGVGNASEPRTASPCDARKVAAMGKMTDGFLLSMSKAARTAISPFTGLIRANDQAGRAIGNQNGAGVGCSNSSARNELQDAAVDPFVTTVADDLASP